MDDDAGSGRSGHMLSCLAGLSGSDAEDIENQLPFGHAQSDGSGDVGDHASESDSDSGDEDPMQHEGSMMEDVRALVEYAMPSELAASPLMGGMSPQAPIGANEGIDSYTSAALAKAAMLMPVSMDLYSVFKEPDTPTHLIGLRRGILAMITLLVLITCTSMHFVLETYTASMRTEVISACSDALTLQNINTDQIMYENITSEKMKQILGTMSQRLLVSTQEPADRALESLWGSLRTMHALNETWDGSIQEYRDQILHRIFVEFDTQWGIQDGPFASDRMAVSDVAPPKNQLKSITVIRNSGDLIGMAGSFSRASCPLEGPVVCGSCVGECKDLDVYAFGSLEGPDGKQLVHRKVNLSTGLPVGKELKPPEPLEWRSRADFQAQHTVAQEAKGSVTSKRWSRIHHIASKVLTSKGALRMSWTQPLAYCGSYSCFDGVVSAEVLLDHISQECKSGLGLLKDMTPPGAQVNAGNASIFVVNQISQHRDQLGLLLGSAEWQDPEREYLPRNATELPMHQPEQMMVAAASRALLAKFHSWDATALLEPQEFRFRKSYALKGEFVECGFHRINYDFVDGKDMDCLQVATKSVELDKFTRWLIVTAVTDGAFNAHALLAQQSAFAMLESIGDIAQTSMNEARIAASVIFFVVGFVSLLIGAVLAWSVSDPMAHLSMDIQQMDEYNGILPEFIIPAARGFAIKDVAEAQRAFRKLLSGIRAFSLFIPEEVVTRIIYGDPRSVRPHVDNRNVTIMFTGIRGIIQMSLNEEQMLSVITRFHKMMTSIVEQYEGTVGEILDEGLLVYFNAPRMVSNHATKACEAGLAQRQAMNTLRQELVDDGWLDPSDAFLRLGVGIHSGNVLVGCIGSAMKMKFGCIGDAMNLTSRLQGLCKFYDVDVMCSEETYLATSQLVTRKVDHLQVKGRQETTAVYEIIGQDNFTTPGPYSTQATSASGVAGPLTTDSSSPKSSGSAVQSAVHAQTIGQRASALTLPIPSSQKPRKRGTLQFLPPEEQRSDNPLLLQNPMSRSPNRRNLPDTRGYEYLYESPVVIGRADSPDRTTPGERTSIGDQTSRTYGGGATSTAASASHYPSPSPGSGSGGRYHCPTSRGYPSSSMSPAGFLDQANQMTTEQKSFAAEYEAALEAYQLTQFETCVDICRTLLKSKPGDTATQLLLEKALHTNGKPEHTVMHEK